MMINRVFKKVMGIGLMVCVMTANVFAAESSWNQKLGIEEVYYPEVNDKIGANSYYTRLGYGMSEGTGTGINLLVVDYQGDRSSSINNLKELYKYIIPNANITYINTGSSTYKDLSKIITQEMIEENDIICVSKFNEKDDYLYDMAYSRKDKYFVISGEKPNDQEELFTSYIEYLSVLDNTLIVAGSNDEGVDQQIISEELLKLIDVFVQVAPTSAEHAQEYSYHSNPNESERMDNAVGVAAGSLALLLENRIPLGDVGLYYKDNSKQRALSLKYAKYSFEPRTEYSIPILDYKALFKKKDNDNFALKAYNLPTQYKGEGIKIALIDAGDSTSLEAQDYIKRVIAFPQDYKVNSDTNTNEMMKNEKIKIDILRDIVPQAEVTLLSTKSDLVNGDLDTTSIKKALDWVLENRDQVDILAINAPVEAQPDKALLEKIKTAADAGIIVNCVWMPQLYHTTSNIITPSAHHYKVSYSGYLNTSDDLRVYDRFFSQYDTSQDYNWGDGAVVSTATAFAAILKQIDPTLNGRGIKDLYKGIPLEIGDSIGLSLPDMKSITTLLEKRLTDRRVFPITASELTIKFDTPTDIKINGRTYRGTTATTIPFSSTLSVTIDQARKRIAEGTQLIDLKVVKANDGTVFIDSSFKGTIATDRGEMEIQIGLNKLTDIHPNVAREITIHYDVK